MQVNTGSEATTPKTVASTDVVNEVNENVNDLDILDSECPVEDAPRPRLLTAEDMAAKKAESNKKFAELESRSALPATGNPAATVAEMGMMPVVPRYDIVQNRSDKYLIIPDLKTGSNEDEMGLALNPGEVVKLTDFYSPQQINRSKGLRYASTKLEGIGGMALVPLNTEEEGMSFTPPQRKKHVAGSTFEDLEPNDFDIRFDELEAKEKKREERLLRKSLGTRKTSKHGTVSRV